MKHPYRKAIVATLVSTVMAAGLFALISETSPSYAEAPKQVPKGFNFIVTGTTRLPGMPTPLLRLEDTDHKIVCYYVAPSPIDGVAVLMNCVKK